MKPPSCPYFVTTKGGQEQFPGKTATADCKSLATSKLSSGREEGHAEAER